MGALPSELLATSPIPEFSYYKKKNQTIYMLILGKLENMDTHYLEPGVNHYQPLGIYVVSELLSDSSVCACVCDF